MTTLTREREIHARRCANRYLQAAELPSHFRAWASGPFCGTLKRATGREGSDDYRSQEPLLGSRGFGHHWRGML